MDDTSSPATPAKVNPFVEAVAGWCRRIFGVMPKQTPQMEAAANAMMVKARNAHAFAPRHPPHPLSVASTVSIGAETFVTFNERFPANLCLIRRGMDLRTYKAALRATKRDKERGYLRQNAALLAESGRAWGDSKIAAGVALAPVKASWAR